MIVRVARGLIASGQEPTVFGALRQAAGKGHPDGLERFFFARRSAGSQSEVVAISIWRDVSALEAVLGPKWHEPANLPGLDDALISQTVEHFDLVAESFAELLRLSP